MMRGRVGLGLGVLCAVWLSPFHALADSVAIEIGGGVTIDASPPPGWCFYPDATLKAMLQEYESVEQPLVVHVFYGDCRQVDANTQALQPIHDFGSLTTPRNYPGGGGVDDLRSFLDETAADVQAQDINPTATSVRDKLNKAQLGIQVGEARSLGLVGRDEFAVYSGVLVGSKVAAGEFTQLVIIGITAIKGRILFSYVNADYESEETVNAVLARSQAQVAQLWRANP
jgi:hypothetical protein